VNDFGESIKGLKEVLHSIPAASAVFEGLESGDLTAAQAYTQLVALLQQEGTDLKELGKKFPIAIPTENAVPMVMKGENGLPMLNPLVEAAIAELASIDGDVPSMRTGPLPENATPALPVETTAANPVMIGMMLEEAAKQIHKAIQLAVSERGEAIKLLEAEAQETGLVVRPEDLPAPITGVEHYKAGAVPAPIVVPQPTTSEIAALTPTQRRKAAHKALATTQGRTSLAPVIEQMLLIKLQSMGITASVGEVLEEGLSVAWAMHSYADDEIHEEFSPVEAAVGSLAFKIKGHSLAGPILLTVAPFNGTSDRHFGWVTRFCLEGS
jgi:hypothetical protein|tara:strand:+ start:995 stop:1969 length:975 start_codon:yes stop_codon:yes gene_type:complete